MKKFQHICHEEPSDSPYGTFRSVLKVSAGTPGPCDLAPHAYGVPKGVPVIVISQATGDDRTSHGSQFQAILPKDARALAAMLIEAAEEAEPTLCPICKGKGKVFRKAFSHPGNEERSCSSCKGSGRLFPPQDQTFAVPESPHETAPTEPPPAGE